MPEDENIDTKQVEEIVKRMKKKYSQEDLNVETESLDELHGIITEGKAAEIEIQRVEDLVDFDSPMIRRLGRLYLGLRTILEPLTKITIRLPFADKLGYYLYAADMKYSAKQWIAISTILGFIGLIFSLLVFGALNLFLGFPDAALIVPIAILAFLMAEIVMLSVPKRKSTARANAINVELPFALRHIATELKSGLGLYRTIQTISMADYGALSEEFSRSIIEIEEGTDTKEALKHMALRTESKPLRNALTHIIRALKTGGNLSNIMTEIAEDVSFELKNSMKDFAQRLNFFGVIFIFIAIVFPVFVAVLGGIRNVPLSIGGGALQIIPLTPLSIAVIYLVIMPLLLLFMISYINGTQPRI